MGADEERGILSAGGDDVHWIMQNEQERGAVNASPQFLSAAERDYYATLKSDKRRRDWLLGRRAAKSLVAGVIGLPPAQITILPHADGWPIVTLPDDHPPLTLSISHSGDRAFCAVMSGADRLLGADVETIAPRSPAFVEDYFTPREREFLAVAPPQQHATLVNAVWSGKEAALKAIRRGLAEDTRLVSCLPHPAMIAGAEWLPMRIAWTEERSGRSLPRLSGLWRAVGDCVLTLAFATGD
jgi:4'-phosphopantetheinyl transferase